MPPSTKLKFDFNRFTAARHPGRRSPFPQRLIRFVSAVTVVVILALLVSPPPKAASARTLIRSVGAVGMTVSDIERSVAFYENVLSFNKISDVEVQGNGYEALQGLFGVRMRIVRMQLGDEQIELTEYLVPRGKPVPPDSNSNDRWFQHIAIIVSDMEKAYQQLRLNKVRHASTGPQQLPDWNKAAAGIKAFYFRDPDDHNLEILWFPPGKGNPKWHNRTDRLFLGIDHTAIVVKDSDESLKFYRDALGLEVAGESENYGPEQEHLNNVFGARLRITSLRAAQGPAIEFLEYLAPANGRPMPADSHANDLWHWQIHMITNDVDAAAGAVRSAQGAWVSPGVIRLPENVIGFDSGILSRDPDGHGLLIHP